MQDVSRAQSAGPVEGGEGRDVVGVSGLRGGDEALAVGGPGRSVASGYRLQSDILFLTYPNCGMELGEAERQLRGLLKDFAFAAICREFHAEGHPHLHAVVSLSRRCNFHSARCLDLRDGPIGSFHGNYQAARSATSCLQYVEKDGCVRYCGGSMEVVRAHFRELLGPARGGGGGAKRKLQDAFERMTRGTTIGQLLLIPDLIPCVVQNQDKLLKAMAHWNLAKSLTLTKKFAMATCEPTNASTQRITQWLNENLMVVRPFATCQLYIYGPSQIGKTSLVQKLAECLRIFYVPDEDFYDDFSDEMYDLIVYDEFRSQKTIQFLNKFLDGSVCPLRQKGRQTVKKRNIPAIFLSNFSLNECYTKVDADRLYTLQRRLVTVYCNEPINIEIHMNDVLPDIVIPVSSSNE